MNPSIRALQLGLRSSPIQRRITLLALRRPTPLAAPSSLSKLRPRARFFADSSVTSKPSANKQHLSTHALSSEAAGSSRAGSSSGAGAGAGAGAAEDPIAKEKTLTGRLKALIRTYGWYALGIYTLIGFVDFSISFGLIQVLGRDRVAEVTDWVKHRVMGALEGVWPNKAHEEEVEHAVEVVSGEAAAKEAQKGNGNAGLLASIALAYAMHKTVFLPFRIGITAGVTPGAVKWLQARGWAGVQGTKRAAEAARAKIQQGRKP